MRIRVPALAVTAVLMMACAPAPAVSPAAETGQAASGPPATAADALEATAALRPLVLPSVEPFGTADTPPGWTRYDLPNLGVSIALPAALAVRTGITDSLGDLTPAPGLDIIGYVARLQGSPFDVSALGGMGVVAVSADGATMVTVAPQQVGEPGTVSTPAGKARIGGYLSDDGRIVTREAAIDIPADDWDLRVRTAIVTDDPAQADDLLASLIATVQAVRGPATTPASPDADAALRGWLPPRVAGLDAKITTLPGRMVFTHPIFDPRRPGALGVLCSSAARSVEDVALAAVELGDTSRPRQLVAGVCDVLGATDETWRAALSEDARTVERFRKPVYVLDDGSLVVLAGQAVLVVRSEDEALLEAFVSALPDDIPADPTSGSG